MSGVRRALVGCAIGSCCTLRGTRAKQPPRSCSAATNWCAVQRVLSRGICSGARGRRCVGACASAAQSLAALWSKSVVFVATRCKQLRPLVPSLSGGSHPRDLTSAHRRCKQPPPRFQWAGRRCARLKRRAGRPTISLRSRSGPEGRVSNCLSGLVSSLASTVSSYCM